MSDLDIKDAVVTRAAADDIIATVAAQPAIARIAIEAVAETAAQAAAAAVISTKEGRFRFSPPTPLAPDEVIARLAGCRYAGLREIRRRTLSNGHSFPQLRKPARLTLPQARDMVRGRALVTGAGTLTGVTHYFRPGTSYALP